MSLRRLWTKLAAREQADLPARVTSDIIGHRLWTTCAMHWRGSVTKPMAARQPRTAWSTRCCGYPAPASATRRAVPRLSTTRPTRLLRYDSAPGVARLMRRLLVYLWAAPTTCLGLLFLTPTLLGRVHGRVVNGVVELHGGAVTYFLRHATLLPGGASAMPLGHVVLGVNGLSLELTREHERVHVRQVERWGPAFIPAYVIASIIAWRRGLDPYRDNPFEVEAYDVAT